MLYRTGQEKYLAATGASMTRPRPGPFESMATEFCPPDVLLLKYVDYVPSNRDSPLPLREGKGEDEYSP